ncbi:MAG: PEGA domain-containing protein [Chloroherpetonaceae bacterium]|nr:PEGA domain-containing protein [Chloroherpetonaceae bacterium]
MKSIVILTAATVFLTFTGCASIMSGSSQDIAISSTPSGASITVNNVILAKTPAKVKLKRKDEHKIKLDLAGFLPYEVVLTTSSNGWVWGNILFGGLIGLAIDAITGAMYSLEPNIINAEMKKEEIGAIPDADLYISIVLKTEPGWKKIGQLEKAK